MKKQKDTGCTDALVWIGNKSNKYPTVDDFVKESQLRGCCRQLPFIPVWMKSGKTKIFLAHRNTHRTQKRGSIFGYFVLHQIEIIAKEEVVRSLRDPKKSRKLWPQNIDDYLASVEKWQEKGYSESDIETCLQSIAGWADELFIVDSFSTDKTIELAKKYTQNIHFHKFENFAAQRNWALENLPIRNDWTLHLDADESLTPELKIEIAELIPNNTNGLDGFYIKRRFIFLGRWLRYGGNYPQTELRLWRHNLVRVIDAGALEYIAIRGRVGTLQHDMIHENRCGLSAWVTKENMVSDWDAEEFMTGSGNARLMAVDDSEYVELGKTRWLRIHVWNRLPLFLRPFLFFFCGFR